MMRTKELTKHTHVHSILNETRRLLTKITRDKRTYKQVKYRLKKYSEEKKRTE